MNWKKFLLIAVVCMATFALFAGVAFATAGSGEEKASQTCTCEQGHERRGCGQGSGPGVMYEYRDEIRGEVAGILGLSLEDLEKELESGKTVMEMAREKGISADQLAETVAVNAGEILDREVAEGNITPEEAEFINTRITERTAACAENGCGFGGRGRCRGMNGGPYNGE